MTHSTRDAPGEVSLDLATVARMLLGVSGEIVLGTLINEVLAVALELGGAERGLFILSRDGAFRVAGEATKAHGKATVRLHDPLTPPPDPVLNTVARVRVLLQEDARQSILALPLIAGDELLGALHLEHPTPHAFAPARVEMLELLAAQAAISLRHALRVADLQGKAAELEHIIDGIPELIWRARPDGSIDYSNRRWTEFLGVADTIPEGPGLTTVDWSRHIHPDDLDGLVARWSTLASGEPYEHLSRVRRADGQYRWLLARGLPHRDDTGTVVRWYGISFDVQDLTEAQEKIRQQDRELRKLLEVVPQQIFVLRADLSVEYANQAILDYHGEALMEALFDTDLDRRDRSLHHPDDMPWLAEEGMRALPHGLPLDVECRLLRKDGAYRWFLIRINPLHDEHGRVVRWYGTRTDIDDRKKTEERVRHDERELRMLVDYVPQHLVVLDAQGRILYANRAALEYTGLTLDEITTRDDVWSLVFHPDDMPIVQTTLRGLAEGIGGEVELRIRRRDGQYRCYLAYNAPLRDDDGRIIRWFATGTDIEDRKRAEQRMQDENLALREEVDKASMFEEIVGSSPSLRTVLTSVAKVAPTDSTVLVTGETGTGKELVARAIHKRSQRAARAFVSVNCAAIPPTLIASELFGHEKGAFTGALQRRPGRFELADGGTIFLDEIGDLPHDTQLALLRVLQEREFERVGSTRPMKVDVRVIAATNRDLEAAMDRGVFRTDLFYRLNVFPIEMPPLRERTADIPLLVSYFAHRYATQAGKTIRHIDKRALDVLESYRWPGNVRELQNVIERAVIICESDTLTVDIRWLSREPAPVPVRPLADELAARERQIIEMALAESSGRISGPTGAAAQLGIPASTLESKIRALGIGKHRFKGA
jgi:formate hydrogenlyase transcriptional activator